MPKSEQPEKPSLEERDDEYYRAHPEDIFVDALARSRQEEEERSAAQKKGPATSGAGKAPVEQKAPEPPFDAAKFYELLTEAEGLLEQLQKIHDAKRKSLAKEGLFMALRSFRADLGKMRSVVDVSSSHEESMKILKAESAAMIDKYTVQTPASLKPAPVSQAPAAPQPKREPKAKAETTSFNLEQLYREKIDLPLKRLEERWAAIKQRLSGKLSKYEVGRQRQIEKLFIHFNKQAGDYFDQIQKPASERDHALLENIQNEFTEDFIGRSVYPIGSGQPSVAAKPEAAEPAPEQEMPPVDLKENKNQPRTLKKNIKELAEEISFFETEAERKGVLAPEPEPGPKKPVQPAGEQVIASGRALARKEALEQWSSFEDLHNDLINNIHQPFKELQDDYFERFEPSLTEAEKVALKMEIDEFDNARQAAGKLMLDFYNLLYRPSSQEGQEEVYQPRPFKEIDKKSVLTVKRNFLKKLELMQKRFNLLIEKEEEFRKDQQAHSAAAQAAQEVKADRLAVERVERMEDEGGLVTPLETSLTAGQEPVKEPPAPPSVDAPKPEAGQEAAGRTTLENYEILSQGFYNSAVERAQRFIDALSEEQKDKYRVYYIKTQLDGARAVLNHYKQLAKKGDDAKSLKQLTGEFHSYLNNVERKIADVFQRLAQEKKSAVRSPAIKPEARELFNSRRWYNENISGPFRILEAGFKNLIAGLKTKGEALFENTEENKKLLAGVQEFVALLDELEEQAKNLAVAAQQPDVSETEIKSSAKDYLAKYSQAQKILKEISS